MGVIKGDFGEGFSIEIFSEDRFAVNMKPSKLVMYRA